MFLYFQKSERFYHKKLGSFWLTFSEKMNKILKHGIWLFCLTIRRDAHQVGQVLDKNDQVFQILGEQKILFVFVFFNIFSENVV